MAEKEKEEVKTEKETQQTVWTPKDIEALIKLGMEWLGINLADKYITYKKIRQKQEDIILKAYLHIIEGLFMFSLLF